MYKKVGIKSYVFANLVLNLTMKYIEELFFHINTLIRFYDVWPTYFLEHGSPLFLRGCVNFCGVLITIGSYSHILEQAKSLFTSKFWPDFDQTMIKPFSWRHRSPSFARGCVNFQPTVFCKDTKGISISLAYIASVGIIPPLVHQVSPIVTRLQA